MNFCRNFCKIITYIRKKRHFSFFFEKQKKNRFIFTSSETRKSVVRIQRVLRRKDGRCADKQELHWKRRAQQIALTTDWCTQTAIRVQRSLLSIHLLLFSWHIRANAISIRLSWSIRQLPRLRQVSRSTASFAKGENKIMRTKRKTSNVVTWLS